MTAHDPNREVPAMDRTDEDRAEHKVYPLRERPGRPVSSGFTVLPPEEQERYRRQHREMMRRLEPFFRDVDQCHARARAASVTAWIR
jgi:hypothetical protein